MPYTNGTVIDYSASSKNLVCKNDSDDAHCYHEYGVPAFMGTVMPGHVTLDSRGEVWYTAYWGGNYIGRLNSTTSTFKKYPLPPKRAQSTASVWLSSGPWQIVADKNDNILVTEYFDSTITRLRCDLLGSACEALNAQNKNPCLDEADIPGADVREDTLHSLAIADDGAVWFATSGTSIPSHSHSALGFVAPDWSGVYLLPPLVLLTGKPLSGAGVAVDKSRGTIWFADFVVQKLGRLRKAP